MFGLGPLVVVGITPEEDVQQDLHFLPLALSFHRETLRKEAWLRTSAGALGGGRPTQDLVVSPQHRILVGGGGQLRDWFETEAFAPAKSLTSLPGIRHMQGKQNITWIHFACDRHEVVFDNGCLSESLLLGPMVLNGLTSIDRQSLVGIFGAPASPDAALNGPPARKYLKVGAVKRQIAKHLKEKGQLLAKKHHQWNRDIAMEQYEADLMHEAQSLTVSSDTAPCVG